ncbi:ATP-binding protein [Thermodesulfobacteriota bacterium]
MKIKSKNRYWSGILPWALLGVFVLSPLLVFMSIKDINRQKENTTRLLVEKGAALIRSFEAGARTGMMGMQWGGRQVQRLLTETSKQPDIAFLIVTNGEGDILAHSKLQYIGKKYGTELDLALISSSEKIQWRIVKDPEGVNIFEVFRRFSPVRGHGWMRHRRMMSNDWCSPHLNAGANKGLKGPRQIIFVGLNMQTIEAARKEQTRHTVIMMLILLLVGSAGIVFLFLAQAYRSTRTSLARVKAFSDNLVENMPIGLVATDGEGRVASFNQTAETVLQLSAGEVIGKKTEDVLPPPLYETLNSLKTGNDIIDVEMDCPLPGKGSVSLEVTATLLEEEKGEIIGYIILFRDLTQIQKLKKEIARSHRLASIGRLAAGVAHEIRNPLSSIKGFATYFGERYKDIPEDRKTADIMVQEVERLNRVISQLLEFARPESIQKKPSSIRNVVQHSLKMVERQAHEKGIKIENKFSIDKDEILLDPDRMGQALLNLYLNAIEAMEEGGRLSVNVSSGEDPGNVVIEIADTGSGINEKDLSHIFDPYFTTKQSGTGLGLAIVHRIIESHGGSVRIESTPGKGTQVYVVIPQE